MWKLLILLISCDLYATNVNLELKQVHAKVKKETTIVKSRNHLLFIHKKFKKIKETKKLTLDRNQRYQLALAISTLDLIFEKKINPNDCKLTINKINHSYDPSRGENHRLPGPVQQLKEILIDVCKK